MAVELSSDKRSVDEDLSITDVVFSCGVCQASIKDVYANPESNQGFHSGSGGAEGIVTKLWISECSHIICSKHLEDGAVPFHPKEKLPEALCPQCKEERGDNSPKQLYGIRGFRPGEYDDHLPASWLVCPPKILDTDINGVECLRFQYLTLGRYGLRVTKRWHAAEEKRHAMEEAYLKEHKRMCTLERTVQDQESKLADFDKVSAKLARWEARKPEIHHHLRTVTEMGRELEVLRSTLTSLGYQVSSRNYAMTSEESSEEHGVVRYKANDTRYQGECRGSSVTMVGDQKAIPSSTRKKRKLREEPSHQSRGQASPRPPERSSSRDLMPPPPAIPGIRPRRDESLPRPRASVPQQRQDVSERMQNIQTLPSNDRSLPGNDRNRDTPHAYRQQGDRLIHAETALPHRLNLPHHKTIDNNDHYVERQPYHLKSANEYYEQDAPGSLQLSMRAGRSPVREGDKQPWTAQQEPSRRSAENEMITARPGKGRYPNVSHLSRDANLPTYGHRPPPPAFQLDHQQLSGTPDQARPGQLPLMTPRASRNAPDASITSPFFKRSAPNFSTQHENPALPQSGSYEASTSTRNTTHGDYLQSTRPRIVETPHTLRPDARMQPLFRSAQSPRSEEYVFQPGHMYVQGEPHALDRSGYPQGQVGRPVHDELYAVERRPDNTYQNKLNFITRKLLPGDSPRKTQNQYSEPDQLSRIKGVRGLASRQGLQPVGRTNLPTDGPRGLLSSAGGRRSVTRGYQPLG